VRTILGTTRAAVDMEIRRGFEDEEILASVDAHRPDLVVVGSRGGSRLPRLLLGSVSESVVRHAPCPALLARPLVHDLRHAVLGIDRSEGADRATEWLKGFPLPAECELRIVTVVPHPQAISPTRWVPWPVEMEPHYQQECAAARQHLDALVTTFALAGREITTELRSGHPAESLLQCAEEQRADLVVVGSRGISAIERFLLGSVSANVLRYAHCSVLVVK
jgi:nucleotide-binding universal stress UspA family protein